MRGEHDTGLLTFGCPYQYAWAGGARGLKGNLEGRDLCVFGSFLIQ